MKIYFKKNSSKLTFLSFKLFILLLQYIIHKYYNTVFNAGYTKT